MDARRGLTSKRSSQRSLQGPTQRTIAEVIVVGPRAASSVPTNIRARWYRASGACITIATSEILYFFLVSRTHSHGGQLTDNHLSHSNMLAGALRKRESTRRRHSSKLVLVGRRQATIPSERCLRPAICLFYFTSRLVNSDKKMIWESFSVHSRSFPQSHPFPMKKYTQVFGHLYPDSIDNTTSILSGPPR